MEKYYKFAGVELSVSIPEQWMYKDEKKMAEFRVDSVDNPESFRFELVKNLQSPAGKLVAAYPDYCVYQQKDEEIYYVGSVQSGWENAYIRAVHCGKKHCVQIKTGEYIKAVSEKAVLNSLRAEHLVVGAGGFILHASYIEVDGKAILFTAPSEIGKSTQADLWCKYRQARIINGDRTAVRLENGEAFAAGIPFSGSSKFCKNGTFPLAAIVYLQQAPITTIRKLEGAESFRKIWEGCTVNLWDQKDVKCVVDTVQNLINRVPVYQLSGTADESAVIALEEALKEV